MKIFKKNQIVISVIALMLITAGFLNYNSGNTNTVETLGSITNTNIASIGDAVLVNSQNIIENTIENSITNNAIETSKIVESNYFTESKLEREKMYSQMLESYQKILESDTISQEQKTIATNEIGKINSDKNAIMITENLIKMKDFEDVVIFVNSDSISVIIKKEELKIEEIAQIQNIISRELKADVDNIHISCK